MSLNQSFRGESVTSPGYMTSFKTRFLISEAHYATPSLAYGIRVANGYIDGIDHRRNVSDDVIDLSLSSELKKYRNWVAERRYSYTSPLVLFDNFDQGNIYSDRWQAVTTSWSQSNGFLNGFSNSLSEVITNTNLGKALDVVVETKVRNDTDAVNVFDGLGVRIDNTSLYTANSLSVILDYNSNSVLAQQRSPGSSLANYFGTSRSLTTNTFYWLRAVAAGDRFYGYFSSDGQNWDMLGNTFVGITNVNNAGSGFLSHRFGNANFEYYKVFESKRLWDVKGLVEDLSYKAGVGGLNIPNVYDNTLQAVTGLTYNINGWSFGSGASTVAGRGTSTSNTQWTMLGTGVSFKDFRMDVDFTLGLSSTAGIFAGTGFTNFAGIYFTAKEPGTIGVTLSDSASLEVVTGGLTRSTVDIPAGLFNYPYVNKTYKLSLIKNDDRIYFLVDDILVHAEQGLSTVNIDSENMAGFMIYSRGGVSMQAQYTNMRFTSLYQVVQNFEIQSNSSAMSALERLSSLSGFNYTVRGDTVTIIPDASINTGTSLLYNLGISHLAWDIVKRERDDFTTHLTKIGADDLQYMATDMDLVARNDGLLRGRQESDELIKTYPDLALSTESGLRELNSDFSTLSYEQRVDIRLEKYDRINVIDRLTGTSGTFVVENFNKNYNPVVGDFTQTLQLSEPI